MRGYKIKLVHVFDLAMHSVRAWQRVKTGNNHTYGFPIGPSGKKRAYRITIRSPYFSKNGFFQHTKIFSTGHPLFCPKMYHFIEATPSKSVLKQRRIKILRKPK